MFIEKSKGKEPVFRGRKNVLYLMAGEKEDVGVKVMRSGL